MIETSSRSGFRYQIANAAGGSNFGAGVFFLEPLPKPEDEHFERVNFSAAFEAVNFLDQGGEF